MGGSYTLLLGWLAFLSDDDGLFSEIMMWFALAIHPAMWLWHMIEFFRDSTGFGFGSGSFRFWSFLSIGPNGWMHSITEHKNVARIAEKVNQVVDGLYRTYH